MRALIAGPHPVALPQATNRASCGPASRRRSTRFMTNSLTKTHKTAYRFGLQHFNPKRHPERGCGSEWTEEAIDTTDTPATETRLPASTGDEKTTAMTAKTTSPSLTMPMRCTRPNAALPHPQNNLIESRSDPAHEPASPSRSGKQSGCGRSSGNTTWRLSKPPRRGITACAAYMTW